MSIIRNILLNIMTKINTDSEGRDTNQLTKSIDTVMQTEIHILLY